MFLTIQTAVEISQLQMLDKVLDMPVLVQQEVLSTRTVASTVYSTSTAPFRCQSSVVAVHRQGRRHTCRGAGAVP